MNNKIVEDRITGDFGSSAKAYIRFGNMRQKDVSVSGEGDNVVSVAAQDWENVSGRSDIMDRFFAVAGEDGATKYRQTPSQEFDAEQGKIFQSQHVALNGTPNSAQRAIAKEGGLVISSIDFEAWRVLTSKATSRPRLPGEKSQGLPQVHSEQHMHI